MERVDSILVVEPKVLMAQLIDTILDETPSVVDYAETPKHGFECIKSKGEDPYQIIWAESSEKGETFLDDCCKVSPLSARILSSTSLSEYEMDTMVGEGKIHSHYAKRLNTVVEPILSALGIGLEFHQILILEKFFDYSNFESLENIENTLELCRGIEKKIPNLSLPRAWIDFDGRDTELDQLSNVTQKVINKIPLASAGMMTLEYDLIESQNTDVYIVRRIQKHVSIMNDYLVRSKNHIRNTRAMVAKTNLHVSETRDKIKQLKKDFDM